jgi:flagellar hook-associated protein 3 FlgL
MSGWGAIYNNSMYGLYVQTSQIAKLSDQATTGQRIIRASDDPTAAYQIMHLLKENDTYASYVNNIGTVSDSLTNADTILQQVSSDIASAQQTATQMATNSYGDQQRSNAAAQIDSLLKECVSLANSQQVGQYTFSGDAATTQPYQTVMENGKIVAVNYQGGRNELTMPVAPGVSYSGTLVGGDVFGLHSRQDPVLAATAMGVSVGSGTSTAHGDFWLDVRHTATTLSASDPGITVGDGTAGDTILGDHAIHLDADAKTIQLDDGTVTSYTGSETNLTLTNSTGDLVHLNMSTLTGGTTGQTSFTVHGDGEMSIDNWKTATPISFQTNDAVVNANGERLYVNTDTLHVTGSVSGYIPGTYNLFDTLISLRDTLENGRNLAPADISQRMEDGVNALTELNGGVTRASTTVGAKAQAMDRLKTTIQNVSDDAKSRESQLGSADIASLSTELVKAQTLYEMTLSSTGKMMQISLLNYL